MQEYIGGDLHERSAVIVKKNRRGEITEKATVATTAAAPTVTARGEEAR
jgi:hypothetical protein